MPLNTSGILCFGFACQWEPVFSTGVVSRQQTSPIWRVGSPWHRHARCPPNRPKGRLVRTASTPSRGAAVRPVGDL